MRKRNIMRHLIAVWMYDPVCSRNTGIRLLDKLDQTLRTRWRVLRTISRAQPLTDKGCVKFTIYTLRILLWLCYNDYATCIFVFREIGRWIVKQNYKVAGKHRAKPEGLLQARQYPIPDNDRVGAGQPHAPDYVLRLLEYYIRNEGLMVKEMYEGRWRF